MTIDDLRATLHEHADDVSDGDVAGRADAARRRARGVRRQQIVVALATAIVVSLIGALLLGENPLKRAEPVLPVPSPDPAVVSTFAGRTLLDSQVERSDVELTLTSQTEVPTHWTATCFGVGAEFVLHMTLDGASPGESPCEAAEPPEPLMGYVLDVRFPLGPHTMHLWLTNADGAVVDKAPGAVLAAGVYRLPDPVTVVAGVSVYPRERAYDSSSSTLREWQYVESRQSRPGDARLRARHDADTPMLAQLFATHLASADVRLLVDGVQTDAADVLDGSGFVGPLPPGGHSVELRIRGGGEATAQLGVVWREVAP